MLSYLPYETDEAEGDEFFDYADSDDSDESDEARRRRGRGRPPVRTAKRGGAVPPRPVPGFATRTELTATANRLDAKIGTNATAIKTVESRVATLSSDHAKLRTDLTKAQSSVNDVRNMAMLLPLLSSQTTRTVTTAVEGTEIAANDKVVVDNGDSMSKLLPLLLFSGGFGGSSGGGSSGGGMFGGDGNGIMLVALMMALQPKK